MFWYETERCDVEDDDARQSEIGEALIQFCCILVIKLLKCPHKKSYWLNFKGFFGIAVLSHHDDSTTGRLLTKLLSNSVSCRLGAAPLSHDCALLSRTSTFGMVLMINPELLL